MHLVVRNKRALEFTHVDNFFTPTCFIPEFFLNFLSKEKKECLYIKPLEIVSFKYTYKIPDVIKMRG